MSKMVSPLDNRKVLIDPRKPEHDVIFATSIDGIKMSKVMEKAESEMARWFVAY